MRGSRTRHESSRTWGWHRLGEPFARSIVDRADLDPSDLVLDLGAGDGAITRHLAATGARVIAFELHPERVAELRTSLAGRRVKVVRADVRDLRLPSRPFRVVANPPFDGLTAILARLTSRSSQLRRADLVVPVAVASKWRQRLQLGRTPWRVTSIERIPRRAFTPRPKIDCCVMVVDSRGRR